MELADKYSVPLQISSPIIRDLESALFKIDLNSFISIIKDEWPLNKLSFPDIRV